MSLTVLVTGGRDYQNWKKVHKTLNLFHGRYGIKLLVHGAAKGADFHAKNWADLNKVEHTKDRWVPRWEEGKSAGIQRNKEMYEEHQPDLVIAFNGGNGTAHMSKYAAASGCPTLVVPDPVFKPLDMSGFSAIDDGLVDVLTFEPEIVDEPEEPTEPYWLCHPTVVWKIIPPTPKPTPAGRYESQF